jgi:hypothetical protein
MPLEKKKRIIEDYIVKRDGKVVYVNMNAFDVYIPPFKNKTKKK